MKSLISVRLGLILLQSLQVKTLQSVCRRLRSVEHHCESRKKLRLQGEAALKTPSFRDAEPQLFIPQKTKKNHGVPPMQTRPGICICLTTTDPCLPIIACNEMMPIVRGNLLLNWFFNYALHMYDKQLCGPLLLHTHIPPKKVLHQKNSCL